MDALKNDVKVLKEELQKQKRMNASRFGLPEVKLPLFEGRSDKKTWSDFLDDLYEYAAVMGFDNERLCGLMPIALRGEARLFYNKLGNDVKDDWSKLVDGMALALKRDDDTILEQAELSNRKQGVGETVIDFAKEIGRLVNRAFPKGVMINGTKPHTDEYLEAQKVKYFINGLRPSLKEVLLRDKRPATLQETITKAIDEERLQETIRKDRVVNEATVAAVQAEQTAKELREELEDLRGDLQQVAFVAGNNNNFQRGRHVTEVQRHHHDVTRMAVITKIIGEDSTEATETTNEGVTTVTQGNTDACASNETSEANHDRGTTTEETVLTGKEDVPEDSTTNAVATTTVAGLINRAAKDNGLATEEAL
ncbi:hypothetical protein AAVH_25718 [Aphelenchoides avenae]|nr:hypothetical protein AAVH_25718 [Aphelenchus avenae]